MTLTPDPPVDVDVPPPSFTGPMWPEGPLADGPASDPRPDAQPPKSKWGRRVVVCLVVLALVAGTYLIGRGIGVAEGRDEALVTQPQESYDEGMAEGLRVGRDEGYASGLEKGRTAGRKSGLHEGFKNGYSAGEASGRQDGFEDGYDTGRGEGRRMGLVRGCRAVFDELETEKVIDGPAGPYEKYWYLTRDQCDGVARW